MNSCKPPARSRALARFIVIFCLLACAGLARAQPDAPPLGGAALEAWLRAGHYKEWRSESGPHA